LTADSAKSVVNTFAPPKVNTTIQTPSAVTPDKNNTRKTVEAPVHALVRPGERQSGAECG
jgi:hypothetical protein